MKVLHTIEGMGSKFGGIATCTYDLLCAMQKHGHQIDLLAPELKDTSDKLLGEGETWLRIFSNDGIGPMNYSRNAITMLKDQPYDLYHVNGIWQHICHATCKIARKLGKPYVFTPHGMLYPTALSINAWKKWPMRKLWFDRDIKLASGFHVTCPIEGQHLRELGYKGPIAVIGNPVKVTDAINSIFEKRKVSLSGQTNRITGKSIGFLGRLHPIKKVENIIHGLARSGCKEITLTIMGSGDSAYESFLRLEAEKLGICNRVEFVGFVNGQEKFERLSKLSALFVPSDMENFGMIVPEALLVGTPVMASLGTPWESLEEYNCGWWRSNSPDSIASVISEISKTPPEKLFEMGTRGRDFVIDNYEASAVGNKMIAFYSWLLGDSPKPDFVYE